MPGDNKKEYGDYQTPLDFCNRVCGYVKSHVIDDPAAILEPTCGIGNFLYSASEVFGCKNLYGIEINESYVRKAIGF